jgi:hypothetical protein
MQKLLDILHCGSFNVNNVSTSVHILKKKVDSLYSAVKVQTAVSNNSVYYYLDLVDVVKKFLSSTELTKGVLL